MKKNTAQNPMLKRYPNVLLDSMGAQSRFAEAYRTLRTNIHFSVMDRKIRSLVITSAGQSEGKTVTTFNLAYTMSQSGKSVLVIDADLRKPMISRLFNAAKARGVTELLSDAINADITHGVLDDFATDDLFKLVELQKKNGLLKLDSGKDVIEMYFHEGRLRDIIWATRPEEKKLASVLVESGVLSLENAKIALRRRKDTGQKLGAVLTDMGLISEKDLRGPLNMHTMESFQVVSRMKTGEFHFSDLPESYFNSDDADPFGLHQLYERKLKEGENYLFLRKQIETLIQKTDTPNLFVLPSGAIPPNPSELVGSDRMRFLISYLARRFDFVIIDTPPILPASDALLLAPQADGVAMVVKSGLLRRNMVGKAVAQLRRTQANLMGVILNRVDVRREGYYKYYQKYYSNYHADAA
ncbi:polysaccharide biosynthesis tyrosine autokinase [Desulfonema ishimotonii]|nr:polysaccharide biosynthesis tyrosine autokinase [Desulfonema ishimotonii]